MTNTTEQQAPKFVFEGTEYDIDSLSQEQIAIINSIQVADQKMGSMQSELLLLNTGRDALLENLRESLGK